MSFTEGATDGTLNGTSEVTLVAAPESGTRRIVRTLIITNTDTHRHDVTISLKNNADKRVVWTGDLDPGDSWVFGEVGDIIILDTTLKSVVAEMDEAITVRDPDFVTAFGDVA